MLCPTSAGQHPGKPVPTPPDRDLSLSLHGWRGQTPLVTMLLRVTESPETRRWLGWGDGVCRTEALSQGLAEKVILGKLSFWVKKKADRH